MRYNNILKACVLYGMYFIFFFYRKTLAWKQILLLTKSILVLKMKQLLTSDHEQKCVTIILNVRANNCFIIVLELTIIP